MVTTPVLAIDPSHISYREGYKYQLSKNYSIQTDIKGYSAKNDFCHLHKNGILEIKSGYAWDGPSGPTFDTPDFMRGSLVHDALYQLIREGKLPQSVRDDADELLRLCCIEDGMWSVRAWWVYMAVRIEGWRSTDPRSEKKEITAP